MLCKHVWHIFLKPGAQWLSGRVLDLGPKGRGFEPHRRHCVVSLSKNINPSLVLVQPRETRPFITERLLMGRKESNQTNKIFLKPASLTDLSAYAKKVCQHNFLELNFQNAFRFIDILVTSWFSTFRSHEYITSFLMRFLLSK